MARRTYPIDAGMRDRRVTLESRTAGVDSAGMPTETWATLATVYAAQRSLSAMERFTADQLAARYDTLWDIAYRSDMDPEIVDVPATRRLVYRGRTHDIRTADMVGRKEGIELTTIASTT